MASSFERVKDHRYLFRRDGWLYFRRAIPADVRHAFAGKAERQVSLRTMNVAEARRLLPVELARFEKAIADARGVIAPSDIAKRLPLEPSPDEIERGVREWFTERMARANTDYSEPEAVEAGRMQLSGLEAQAAEVASSLKLGAGEPMLTTQWIADALIERLGWSLPEGSSLRRRLHRTVARGQIEAA